jgi:Flp pilus assembly protein TadB
MNTPNPVTCDERSIASTPACSERAVSNSPDPGRQSSRRETILLMALVGLVVAVALFGLVFPALLAPAIAIAVLAVIVAFDWLLPSGELRSSFGQHRTR